MHRYLLLLPLLAVSSCSLISRAPETPLVIAENEAISENAQTDIDAIESEGSHVEGSASGTESAIGAEQLNGESSNEEFRYEYTDIVTEPLIEDLLTKVALSFTWNTQASHPAVAKELNKYRKNPHHFEEIIARGAPYLSKLNEIALERDLPTELIFLPFVESGYNPTAFSQSGAAGLWQFMASTASHLGMERNWWYDDRLDILVSTEQALDYLTYLHNRFNHDWKLALAAYNGGEGHVARQISRAGGKHDFWALKLKKETAAYVPKILAVIEIIKHPQLYGVQLPDIDDQSAWSRIEITQQIDLRRAAKAADMSYNEFRYLNPGFLRGLSAPDQTGHILVPTEQAEKFRSTIPELAASQGSIWDHYSVESGDTLSEIAEQFGTNSKALIAINQLNDSRIFERQVLLVPKSEASRSQLTGGAESIREFYIVREGDSLWEIAHDRGVSVKQIKRLNNLRSDVIRPGKLLTIAETFGAPQIVYQVRSGDSLSRIASRFKVRISDIRSWNEIKGDVIRPGQELLIRPNNS